MDRRHRPFLGPPRWLAVGTVLFSLAGNLAAQGTATPAPTASATPAVTATPWVQASLPPGMSPTPRPVEDVPVAPKPPKPPRPPKPKPTPAPAVLPPPPEDLTREMMQRREAEQRGDAARPANAGPKEPVRLDQLPPDERAAYQRNLPLWRQLPEEERDALRRRADERARQDLDTAYQQTGLNLDHDQREVFDLRYRQERHKLERELQEKANAERTRRLVEISARLKQEFADKSTPGASATPVPKKAPATPAATPDPKASQEGPGVGFMR